MVSLLNDGEMVDSAAAVADSTIVRLKFHHAVFDSASTQRQDQSRCVCMTRTGPPVKSPAENATECGPVDAVAKAVVLRIYFVTESTAFRVQELQM